MALKQGTQLGPFEILAPIGVGGMGEVYRARDSRLDRVVAIKILPEFLAQNAQAKELHAFLDKATADSKSLGGQIGSNSRRKLSDA